MFWGIWKPVPALSFTVRAIHTGFFSFLTLRSSLSFLNFKRDKKTSTCLLSLDVVSSHHNLVLNKDRVSEISQARVHISFLPPPWSCRLMPVTLPLWALLPVALDLCPGPIPLVFFSFLAHDLPSQGHYATVHPLPSPYSPPGKPCSFFLSPDTALLKPVSFLLYCPRLTNSLCMILHPPLESTRSP